MQQEMSKSNVTTVQFEVNVCIRTPCFICFYPYCESIGVFIYCKLKACHKGGG